MQEINCPDPIIIPHKRQVVYCGLKIRQCELVSNFDSDRVGMNQFAKYLDIRSFRSKVCVQTHTQTHDRPMLYLDH